MQYTRESCMLCLVRKQNMKTTHKWVLNKHITSSNARSNKKTSNRLVDAQNFQLSYLDPSKFQIGQSLGT